MRSSSPQRRLRACVPCSQARAKCHFEPGNIERHLCERCEKFGLVCEAKATAGLRRPRRIKQTHDSNANEHESEREPETSSQSQSQTPPDAADTPDQPPYGLTWAQANLILSTYTTSYLPFFPFIPVNNATAQTLHATRPLLLRAVLLVAAPFPSPRSTAAVQRDVLALIAQRLLVDDARGLDVLQALLLVVAWADVSSLCDRQITSLTYAALGCAHTLGITRPPPSVMRQLGRARAPADILQRVETEKDKWEGRGDEHSLEEQRTFLGVYLILTINSTQFGRTNPLDELYITHCCNRLRWTLECPTDALLDTTIRLAQIGGQIHRAFGPSSGHANSNGVQTDLGPDAPRSLTPYLQLLASDQDGIRPALEAIMEGLDAQGRGCAMFRLNYYYLLIRLYEPATLPLASGHSPERSECLERCLGAVNAYIALLLDTPPSSLHTALYPATQSTFVVIMATRLLLLDADEPGWDRDRARQRLDLPRLADRVAGVLDEAEKARVLQASTFAAETGQTIDLPADGNGPGMSRLASWAEGMRGIRDWIEAKMRGDDVPPPMGDGQAQNPLTTGMMEFESTIRGGRGPVWFSGMWHNVNWDLDT